MILPQGPSSEAADSQPPEFRAVLLVYRLDGELYEVGRAGTWVEGEHQPYPSIDVIHYGMGDMKGGALLRPL